MSNSTDNFGNLDPFFEESADPHQGKPEPEPETSEGNLGWSGEYSGTAGDYPNYQPEHPEGDFGTSGDYPNYQPDISGDDSEWLEEDPGTLEGDSSTSDGYTNLPEHLNSGYEEVSWDFQGTTDDGTAGNHHESDSHGENYNSGFGFTPDGTQDERVGHDAGAFPENAGQFLGDSGQEVTGTDYESWDKYFLPPEGSTEGTHDDQQVEDESNHATTEVEQTWEESRLPDSTEAATEAAPPLVSGNAQGFGDKPSASTQSANSHTQAQTHSAEHNTVPRAPTIQPQDPPHHQAEHKDTDKQPEPTPTLDAIAQGSTTLRTGQAGEAVQEIQRLLNREIDGIFSAELAAQIAQFQESQGIEATGEVDQLTLEKLQAAAQMKAGTTQKTAPSEKPHPTFKLGVQENRGFPQTPAADQEPDNQPAAENQGNPVAEAAEIVKEVIEGAVIGFGEVNAVAPLDDESEKNLEQLRRDTPFVLGEVIGEVGALIQGLGEMMGGGGMMGGGTTEAVVAAPTGVGAIPGIAVADAGALLAGHGAVVAGSALNHLGQSVQNLFNPIEGGGQGESKPKLSGKQEAEAKGWKTPPDEYEWYRRADGNVDVRRRSGASEKGLPEL
jgi:hypothetical protein